MLNAYTIVFAAMLIPAGKLADRIGHRKVFLAGSIVFTVASMACGLAPSAELLIVFRIVQAVGAAALIPSSLALVMHAFAHDQLPRAVAIWGAAGAVAGALGPTLGAAIVEGLGWRWAFFINLPVGIYTVVAGRKNLHESSDPNTQVPSLVGVVLIAAAAGLLSYGLVGTDDYGWLSARTLGVLVAGLVVLAVFVAHQQHTTAPALDLDLFRIPNFRWANLAMLVFGTAFAALFFGSILFLTDVWGWSVLQAGFGVAPGPVVVGLVAPRAGKLAGRIGQRPLLIAGGVLFASCGLLRLVDARPRRQLPARLLPVDAAQRPRCRARLPAALQRRRPGTATRPRRRRRRRRPSRPPVRRHVRRRAHRRVPRRRRRRHRRLRPDLVAHRRRWTRHVRARPADAHRPPPPPATPADPVSPPPSRSPTRRTSMKIEGSVALVTGANRGLGAAFCRTLLDRGASKVYAGARDLHSLDHRGVVPVQLDVTSATDIAAAAASCGDVTLLINNAGIGTGTAALADDALDAARREFETNVYGPLALSHAFAPALAANGGGAIVNVLSVLSWLSMPATAIYCASKAAGWSLTNSLRQELASQHTQVLGLYVGYMDTDMTAGITAPKSDPVAVAHQTLDGLDAGAHEVLADDISRHVRGALSGDLLGLYPQLAG